MKYKNAGAILPSKLIEEIQKYVQGEFLYIPKKDRQTKRAVTEYKIELEKRNNRIYKMHLEGIKNELLAQNFSLAESSIRRILNNTTAYLRWIYVNGDITGKGIGT